jgi:hypothetical protein
MKLIPKSSRIPSIGETEFENDPIVYLKLFHPCSNWTWYITEYSEKDKLCFGVVDGHEPELGYFSLTELSELIIRGLPVERDLHFQKMKLSKLMKGLKAGN